MVEALTCRHSDLVINVINVRYVLFQCPYFCCESTIESINRNLFQEFPDANKLVVVVPLNPIAKQFPKISNRRPHRNSSTQPYPTTLRYP